MCNMWGRGIQVVLTYGLLDIQGGRGMQAYPNNHVGLST